MFGGRMFRVAEKQYCRSDIFTLGQLEDVLNQSATCSVAQPGRDVNYYEWDTFFDQHFKKIKGISKHHHFKFVSTEPGKVTVQELRKSPPKTVTILKTSVAELKAAGLPNLLPRGGITAERAEYLHKEIREFVPDPFKDDLCPPP